MFYRKANGSIERNGGDFNKYLDDLNDKNCINSGKSPTLNLMYERIIFQMKSEIVFLSKLVESTKVSLRDEVNFLREQLLSKDRFIESFTSNNKADKIDIGINPTHVSLILKQRISRKERLYS